MEQLSKNSIEDLLELPAASLKSLAEAFESGPLQKTFSAGLIAPYVGPDSEWATSIFTMLKSGGCGGSALAEICRGLYAAKNRIESSEKNLYIALSGPEVHDIPVVDTATVVRSLFQEAEREVSICSFVIYPIPGFFTPLVQKMAANSDFKVRFIVDVSHERKSPDESMPIVANRFRKRFLETCWIGPKPPELFHDPRPFSEDESKRGTMHAKVVIVDRRAALLTSANFTQAAQSRNIEAGFLCRDRHQVERIANYFDALQQTKHLVPIE